MKNKLTELDMEYIQNKLEDINNDIHKKYNSEIDIQNNLENIKNNIKKELDDFIYNDLILNNKINYKILNKFDNEDNKTIFIFNIDENYIKFEEIDSKEENN